MIGMDRFDWSRLARVTTDDPLRVLVSACTVGLPTAFDGTAYTHPSVMRLQALACVAALPFCPEEPVLGTPRPLTTIHGGDGHDVLAGTARVLADHVEDVSAELIAGAEQMLARALSHRAELAILTDVSDSCGSNVIYLGNPDEGQRVRQGIGVAAAMLARAGIPVMAQRDDRTLGRILAALDPRFQPAPDARDFVDTDWYQTYFREHPPHG